MDKPATTKFKYILSPENTYIVDFGDLTVEILGSEIMSMIRARVFEVHDEDN
jgi:hypothetical protein